MELDFELKIGRDVGRIVFIAGLPGMGLTGKQAVDFLIKTLTVDKVGVIKHSFLGPPVITTLNGIVDDLMEEMFTFYYAEKDGRRLLLFTGAVQPISAEWQHIVSYSVVKKLRDLELDVEAIYTLAATPIEYYKYDVSIYGVATSKDFLNTLVAYGVIPMQGEGAISGMNGLIIGYAKKLGFKGASLLAETYLRTSQDFIAPYALVKLVSKMLKLDIDMRELEERANIFHQEFIKHVKTMSKEAGDKDKGLGYIS